MKYEDLKEELGDLIHEFTQENFEMGYNPIEDIICELEHNSEYISIKEEDSLSKIWDNDSAYEEYEAYKENARWEYRCRLREKMAPEFYETYFLPFFNSRLKDVYDNDLTEELEFYKPTFEEWLFMILAVMTEYYFREKYPISYDRLNWFKLDLLRGRFKSDIYGRYNSIPW